MTAKENPKPDIPGNMQMILEGKSKTGQILVQNRESCRKLLSLGASDRYIRPFGFVYGFDTGEREMDQVLTLTNSDQIESLEEVVKGLPEMQIHVAAITEMSAKLLSFGSCPNDHLCPAATGKIIGHLLTKCGWYFDINCGSEIKDAVKRAFANRLLILGFKGTLHRAQYVAPEHVFPDAKSLIRLVKELLVSKSLQEEHRRLQEKAAMSEPVEAYQRLLSGDEESTEEEK